MRIELLGILRVETSLGQLEGRQRVIYFARPIDPDAPPKSVPDDESLRAAWLTLAELEELVQHPPPRGLRGDEPLVWARYLEDGGPVYPLSVLSFREGHAPRMPTEDEQLRMAKKQ